MSKKFMLKAIAATLACAFALGIAPIANESIPSLTLTASAASYSVVYPAEGVDYFIACESNTNYVVDLYGGGTDTYSNFNVYEKNGSGAQIFTLKRVDGDWYEIIHKESGKCINVVRGESYDDARLWLYPYYSNDYASQFRFAAAGDSYIIQNRLDTQRILDLHDNIAYSGAKLHLWSLHDGQSGRWKLIPANTSSNSSNNSYSNFCNGTYKVNSWDGVNVRSGAGTGYSWVGTALNGTTFKVSKTSGDWGYTDSIKTNAGWKSGWLCLAYCDIQNDNSSSSNNSSSNFNNGTYKVNSWDGVNVRSGAGTGYSWVGTALNGTTFKVSKTSGDWGYTDSIKTNAGWKSGWLCLTYCDIQNDSGNSSSNNGSGSVSLSVPVLYQNDTRWRSTKITGTNYTIWGVGCMLTGVTMLYDYNYGASLTPDKMMTKLSFTKDAAMYFSSVTNLGFTHKSYKAGQITQDQMKTIYNILKSGKPVMIGCNNSRGGEHWVVITGYSGDTSWFSASNFTVNDPMGSFSNLQQHLNYVDRVTDIIY